jgi:hypothetical protein
MYDSLIESIRGMDPATAIALLDEQLPTLWKRDYETMPGSTENLVVITTRAETPTSFCRYLFDHAGADGTEPHRTAAEDRVAAAWGTSRPAPATTRDRARLKGFLKDSGWRERGDDRGHFFAHTMGGGLDINLFPQAASINRRGDWRRLETYCARNPGTFCFIRPIYADHGWRPAALEYGVLMAAAGELSLAIHSFGNK